MTPAHIARQIFCRALAAAVPAVAALLAAGSALAQPKPPMPAGRPGTTHLAAEWPADPECLTVAQQSSSTYTISNAACPDASVLASIELAGGGPLARCFVKKIRTQISIASEGAAPTINYQCIEGAEGCSAEIVRDMFPECHAG